MAIIATGMLMSALIAGGVETPSRVPRASAPYTVQTTDGTTIALDAYRGKVILLAFINTECPHCQRTSQMLNRLQASYGQQQLQVLAVAINDEAAKLAPRFIEKFTIGFPVAIDTKANARTYLGIPETGVVLVPVIVVIDRQGTIQAEYGGENRMVDDEAGLRAVIEPLLANQATR
jgi:peroxiredoxin